MRGFGRVSPQDSVQFIKAAKCDDFVLGLVRIYAPHDRSQRHHCTHDDDVQTTLHCSLATECRSRRPRGFIDEKRRTARGKYIFLLQVNIRSAYTRSRV